MAEAIAATVQTEVSGAEAPAAASTPVVPDKFKNADGSVNTVALLASYTELEKKQGTPKTEEKTAEGEAPKTDDKTDKKDEKAEEPKSEVEKEVSGVLKAAGLDLGEFNTEYAKDGKLSEDSYKKLEAKGFTKATVDQFIRGVVATNGDTSAAAEAQITEIKGIAGGDEGYGQMMTWAKESLKPEEIAEFNDAVSSGKAGIAKAAVQMLKGKFDAAEGREPNLINGGNSHQSGEVFGSWNEMEAAMSDKRYGKDPAYTKSVEAKALRSDVRKR